ncbi:glycosyltransferase [Flavivirga aquimarina]|uniref:Glycosyltransferase n=1 Tax=Flavivirga aquimarina TaxID=2027862 RepID=A0ABT8WD01_9FLAO|nr:glycosyltransferase [Flavivirga aquimarina]MDO5970928.1 glycosyltransferase [Flavivirga aquimarina]
MLSILIPAYNINTTLLVKELYNQIIECNIEFEILVYDDGSKSSINITNREINLLKNCTFKELPNNIGRSAIRNLLANDSKFENLLFIDAGTFPKKKSFIRDYISLKNKNVVHGGMTAMDETPKPPFKLRWVYTKKRESKKGLHSCNFFVKKNILKKNPFDETLKKYGYEDVLFFNSLKKKNIPVYSIENPVIHNTDDDANTFIRKNEDAIENLVRLINDNKLEKDKVGISKYYYQLKKIKLDRLLINVFKILKPFLTRNFNSSYPSLLLYDFYRLGYFCLLKTKK